MAQEREMLNLSLNDYAATSTLKGLLDETFRLAVEELRKQSKGQANDYAGSLSRYQEAVGTAFAVTFEGQRWTLVSTHFVRLGVEKVTDALANWAATQGMPVEPFQFYRQVFGPMRFVSSRTPVQGYYAKSNASVITVYSWPDGTPRVMTPNNVIHELGHSFDRFSGHVGLSVTASHGAATRDGMGYPDPIHLLDRDLFLSVGRWIYDGETDTFGFARDNGVISEVDAKALGVPDTCLGREFWGIDGWAAGLYKNDYSHLCLVDQLRQSFDIVDSEVIADAFLNWVVRHEAQANGKNAQGFDPASEKGRQWIKFLDEKMATFCRNVVLSHNADLRATFYQDKGVLPPSFELFDTKQPTLESWMMARVINNTKNLRRTPRELGGNIYSSLSQLGFVKDETIHIYGQVPDAKISDRSKAWLLIGLPDGRWGWIASNAVQVNLASVPAIDFAIFEQFSLKHVNSEELSDIVHNNHH
jgi:hypothetical protein